MDAVKTLTISVAAYNVLGTLEACLDSCLASDVARELDIVVVNDGSTDQTADLVRSYEERYPGIVRLIDKLNGGYGSTVNASIAVAYGRYFRLLDGDDWVDAEGLSSLVRALRGSSADIAIAPFVERTDGGERIRTIDQADLSVAGEVPFAGNVVPGRLAMHSICYRTELLRSSGLQLPEHCLYTDTLYDVVPLQLVRTAYVTHTPVYQYRMGTDGQSVSLGSLEAHRLEMRSVVERLIDLYVGLPDRTTLSAHVLLSWIAADVGWLSRIVLGMKGSLECRAELRDLLDAVRRDPDVRAACRAESKVFRALDLLPSALYPVAVHGYGVVRKITGS